MFHNGYEEERGAPRGSKLEAVFSKLAAVLPKAQELGTTTNKAMSSDIIESVLADSPIPLPANLNFEPYCISEERSGLCLTISSLNHRLELELRSAKRTLLACGEVLLPCGLLYRVARDILAMAESEPCGIRGCLIYLNFDIIPSTTTSSSSSSTVNNKIITISNISSTSNNNNNNNINNNNNNNNNTTTTTNNNNNNNNFVDIRQLATIKCDPTTATTFELYLTLKQAPNKWNFLPQFLKNLTRGGTIVVSPAYVLSKKKLYRSNLD